MKSALLGLFALAVVAAGAAAAALYLTRKKDSEILDEDDSYLEEDVIVDSVEDILDETPIEEPAAAETFPEPDAPSADV
ncbi:MAG: hypothetical protein LBC56_07560 [Oscillospiraceae bacterium]|jgi:transaldolase|nr:hypothetical protein [Oscillospiraceae bacterium]